MEHISNKKQPTVKDSIVIGLIPALIYLWIVLGAVPSLLSGGLIFTISPYQAISNVFFIVVAPILISVAFYKISRIDIRHKGVIAIAFSFIIVEALLIATLATDNSILIVNPIQNIVVFLLIPFIGAFLVYGAWVTAFQIYWYAMKK